MLVSTIGPIFGCGLLAAWSMNVGFSKFHLGWRVPYAIIALLGVAYFIGMLYAPHTPRCDACYCLLPYVTSTLVPFTFLCSPNFFRLHLVNCLASGFSSNYVIISYLFDPQYTCTGVVGVVILALSLTVFEETALFWCSRQALTLQSPTVRASVLY